MFFPPWNGSSSLLHEIFSESDFSEGSELRNIISQGASYALINQARSPYEELFYSQIKTRDLIGQLAVCPSRIGPPKGVLDRQKGVLDRKIERPTSTDANKMDDRNVYARFGFINKIFILNEIEKLERIYLPATAFKEDTNMFSFEFEEGFGL